MWLRKTCLILSKNNYTPIPFWLSLSLRSLGEWIEANNQIIEEQKQK